MLFQTKKEKKNYKRMMYVMTDNTEWNREEKIHKLFSMIPMKINSILE